MRRRSERASKPYAFDQYDAVNPSTGFDMSGPQQQHHHRYYRNAAMPNNLADATATSPGPTGAGTGQQGPWTQPQPQPQQPPRTFVPKYNTNISTGFTSGGGASSYGTSGVGPQANMESNVPPQNMNTGNTARSKSSMGSWGQQEAPNFGNGMVGGVMQQAAQQYIGQIGKREATRILACLDISALKIYFAVDNSYVLHKLRLILCPFRHPDWTRKSDYSGGIGSGGPGPASPTDHALLKPPRTDVNAPDLYIPTMAFITYILVFAYALGVDNRFNPEVLSLTASWALVTLTFEVLVFWGGFWFLNVESAKRPFFLDLLAYCSYKFVGVICGMLSGLAFGSTAYYVVTISLGITMGLFLAQTLSHITQVYDGTANQKRYFLAVMGILQIILAYFLSKGSLPIAAI